MERHFVILCFAARWQAGEPVLNEELSEAHWLDPAELAGLKTTAGLADIVAAAFDRLNEAGFRFVCVDLEGYRPGGVSLG